MSMIDVAHASTRGKRGQARMRQIAKEDAMRRQEVAACILADLGRMPSMIDTIAAQHVAALYVRVMRLEGCGRNTAKERQQLTQALRAAGFKPPAPVAKPLPSIAEQLRARGIDPPPSSSGSTGTAS